MDWDLYFKHRAIFKRARKNMIRLRTWTGVRDDNST